MIQRDGTIWIHPFLILGLNSIKMNVLHHLNPLLESNLSLFLKIIILQTETKD